MKKTFRNFIIMTDIRIVTLLILFISPFCNAQQKLKIENGTIQTAIDKYEIRNFDVFPIVKKEIEDQKKGVSSMRSAYMIAGTSIRYDTLIGTYIVFPEKFQVFFEDFRGFKKEELVKNFTEYDTRKMSKSYFMIQKENTEEYYFIMSDQLIPLLIQDEMIATVRKIGYKEIKDGENYYIKSKTAEITLNTRLMESLEKNPHYIDQLDNDQIKIANLVKQTSQHSTALNKYLSQYRIQKSKTSTATLNAWRTATNNAQKLLVQINKVTEKYDGDYSFRLQNRSNTLDVFLDNLAASKSVLGM